MVRKGLIAVFAVLALAAGFGPRIERVAPAFQSENADETPAAQSLALGEALAFPNADLVVEDFTVEAAYDAIGYSDVRVAVTMQNTGAVPVSYSGASFLVDPTFPQLVLVDGAGDSHPIDTTHLAQTVVPGSDLAGIAPGLKGRWTVGFRVPTVSAADLRIQATSGSLVLAEWSLAGAGTKTSFEPPSVATASVGESIVWSDDVTVTPLELGSLVCGDPTIEPVSHVVTVTFRVDNNRNEAIEWPGVREPDVPAIVQWEDGSSAEFAHETYVGDAETLPRVSGRGSLIPPGTSYERALIFAAPRDARFTEISELPSGVLLTPTAGGPTWIDLSGVPASIGISPEFCDLGFTEAPNAYAFSPAPSFTPFATDPRPAQDANAVRLLDLAIAGAGLYYDSAGLSFEEATAADLAAFTPRVGFLEADVTTEIADAVGTVVFDTDPDNDDFIIVMTQSESGTWFCNAVEAASAPSPGQGGTSLSAAEACWPDAFGGGTSGT